MPKAYSNRAMPSYGPCNLGRYDHTDSPAHKTPDTADDLGAMLDDGLVLHYLEALRKGVMLSG